MGFQPMGYRSAPERWLAGAILRKRRDLNSVSVALWPFAAALAH